MGTTIADEPSRVEMIQQPAAALTPVT